MEMRFMWVGDKVSQEMFDLTWHPGIENLADYQSKHHMGAHHVKVRHITYIWIIPPGYYQGHFDLAL